MNSKLCVHLAYFYQFVQRFGFDPIFQKTNCNDVFIKFYRHVAANVISDLF